MIFLCISFTSFGSELTAEETKAGISGYTVLVLDVSGSMAGTHIAILKGAANKFFDDISNAVVNGSQAGYLLADVSGNLSQ